MKSSLQKTLTTGWWLAAAGILAALGFYGWIGSFMRYMGDDYCYGMILTQKGFWQAQWHSYLVHTPYAGDRFSLTFFSDLFQLAGPEFTGWLPGLTLLIWVIGLWLVFRQVSRLLRARENPVIGLAGAAAFVFFVLYQAPNLAESFYWRSGMLPYFMPLVGGTWLAGWLLALVQKERPSWYEYLGIGLLAFSNTGFSETAGALQVGCLGLGLIFTGVTRRRRNGVGRNWKPVAAALAATLLAMLAMLLSPSNKTGLDWLPESLGLLTSIGLSLRYAFDFAFESLRGLPLPTFLGLAISAGLGFELSSGICQPAKLAWRKWLGWSALILGCGYSLLVCCMAPSVFIQTWYPGPRALMVARFAMEIALFGLGGLAGWFLRGVFASERATRLAHLAIVALMLAFAAYGVRGAARPLADLPAYRQYAFQWDQRDAQIRQEAGHDMRAVTVDSIPHLLLRGGDFSTDANHWYNDCAAGYYGVNSIQAQP